MSCAEHKKIKGKSLGHEAAEGTSAMFHVSYETFVIGGSRGSEAQTPTHDLDGNMTFDGQWHYTWNGDGARQRGDGEAPKG
jgi:hypothetical protein